ncbi:MAG: ATP-binding protein [Thiohalomonadaceae bacterium]
MKLRLKAKYTLSITAVIVVVALVLLASLHLQFDRASDGMRTLGAEALEQALTEELKSEALGLARIIGLAVADALARGDHEAIAILLDDALEQRADLHHSLVHVGVFDDEGARVHGAGQGPTMDLMALPKAPEVILYNERLVATVPVRRGQEILGAVRVGLRQDGHAERIEALQRQVDDLRQAGRRLTWTWSFGLTLGLVLLGALAGRWLAGRMSRPITALAQAARALPETFGGSILPPAVGHDEIAELTRAFQGMRARLDETTVSRDFLEAIIGGMHDCLVVTDPEGCICLVNPAAAALFGKPREALEGRRLGELFELPFRFEETDQAPVMESTVFRADRGAVPVAVSRSRFGAGGGSIFVIRDITEQKRLTRELEGYRSQLEKRVAERTRELTAALQELEAFSYSVSHDLHAPLRAINGFGAALREDYGDRLDGVALDYLERMGAASVRMGELIDGLLELSRVVRTELVREDVDLSALAAEISTSLADAEPERRVITRIAPGLRATGDRRLLRALLHNLVENAWKFSRGRAATEVEFGAMERHGESAFFVRDNGDGFDLAEGARLFEPFIRLRTDLPGTGLGLATAARIVQRHGGRLWAEAAPGRGAAFYFTLPGESEEESRVSARVSLS